MKNQKHSLLPLLLVLLLGIGMSGVVDAYERQMSRENRVWVEVVPTQLISGKPIKFEIRMNTHSVDLHFDMVAVATLKDDQGNEYRPVIWSGAPPGGHHRSGFLEFPTLKGRPLSVELVLKDIADVPERVFKWKIEQ